MGGNERKTRVRGTETSRKGAKKGTRGRWRNSRAKGKRAFECIQVCVSIRKWQDIFGEVFLVLDLSSG